MLYGAAQVEFPKEEQSVDPRKRLYARYIDYALGRDSQGSPRQQTAREPLLHYLGWLAAAMQDRSQTVFAFEDLDATWLRWRGGRLLAKTIFLLQYWALFTISYLSAFLFSAWLVFGGKRVLSTSAALALICGMVFAFGNIEERDGPVEEIQFSLRAMMEDWYRNVLAIVTVSLLVHWIYKDPWSKLLPSSVAGLIGLFIFSAFKGRPVGESSGPNSGTLRSVSLALKLELFGLALAIFGWVARHFHASEFRFLWFTGSVTLGGIALLRGGLFVVQHYSARSVLWMFDQLPLMAVRFLNESTDRLLLERYGGRYAFLHSTFRDYMADLYRQSLREKQFGSHRAL